MEVSSFIFNSYSVWEGEDRPIVLPRGKLADGSHWQWGFREARFWASGCDFGDFGTIVGEDMGNVI